MAAKKKGKKGKKGSKKFPTLSVAFSAKRGKKKYDRGPSLGLWPSEFDGVEANGAVKDDRLDDLIKFLKERGGILQVLMMNPTTQAFATRQAFEEDSIGRIQSEWGASIKILLGIRQNEVAPRSGHISSFYAERARSVPCLERRTRLVFAVRLPPSSSAMRFASSNKERALPKWLVTSGLLEACSSTGSDNSTANARRHRRKAAVPVTTVRASDSSRRSCAMPGKSGTS